jgi:hypothetical protein
MRVLLEKEVGCLLWFDLLAKSVEVVDQQCGHRYDILKYSSFGLQLTGQEDPWLWVDLYDNHE